MFLVTDVGRKKAEELISKIDYEIEYVIYHMTKKCLDFNSLGANVNISDMAKQLECGEGLLIHEFKRRLEEKRYIVGLAQEGKDTYLYVENSNQTHANQRVVEYNRIDIAEKYEESIEYNYYERYEEYVFVARFSNEGRFRDEKKEVGFIKLHSNFITCKNGDENPIPLTIKQHELLFQALVKLEHGCKVFTKKEIEDMEENYIYLDKKYFEIEVI